jgi:hypothetical protein
MKGRIAALGGILLSASFASVSTGHAQTISYADAMTLLTRDCGADVKKFCKGVNLGNGQLAGCLDGHRAQVSPQCVSTLTSVVSSIETRLAAQASVFKVCAANAATLCRGVHGEVHILQCLIKTERIDSAHCNQAITDAGWR